MGVDQNKGICGSCNRRSTANQPRSQRYQSRECSFVYDAILRRDLSKHDWVSQHLVDMAWTRAILRRFEQSRINRGSTANQSRISSTFSENFQVIWLMRRRTLLLWFFFAIGYHYEHRFQADPNVSPKTTYNANHIGVSSCNSWFSYNKCLSQSRTNRRSISMQGSTIADVVNIGFHLKFNFNTNANSSVASNGKKGGGTGP